MKYLNILFLFLVLTTFVIFLNVLKNSPELIQCLYHVKVTPLDYHLKIWSNETKSFDDLKFEASTPTPLPCELSSDKFSFDDLALLMNKVFWNMIGNHQS